MNSLDFGHSKREAFAAEGNSGSVSDSAPDASAWGRWEILERETGFEPATLTLAT